MGEEQYFGYGEGGGLIIRTALYTGTPYISAIPIQELRAIEGGGLIIRTLR